MEIVAPVISYTELYLRKTLLHLLKTFNVHQNQVPQTATNSEITNGTCKSIKQDIPKHTLRDIAYIS